MRAIKRASRILTPRNHQLALAHVSRSRKLLLIGIFHTYGGIRSRACCKRIDGDFLLGVSIAEEYPTQLVILPRAQRMAKDPRVKRDRPQ